jgi:hypothetical protein
MVMKPYGIPRVLDIECPDCADALLYALKSSKVSLRGKSPLRHAGKIRARRVWKKLARRAARVELRREMAEN